LPGSPIEKEAIGPPRKKVKRKKEHRLAKKGRKKPLITLPKLYLPSERIR